MPKIKLQHYVSRFYLKNFCRENTNILECFDKVTGRTFSSDLSNVAAEKFFYDEPKNGDQHVEKKLATLEGKFASAIVKLIEKRDITNLSDEERTHLTIFIATQFVRSKEKRETIRDMINQLAKKLADEKLSESLKNQLACAQTDEGIKDLHIRLLSAVNEIAPIIAKMKWILIVNKTKTPFWTSDNPIHLWNEIDHSPYGSLGLTKSGIELHFPITPELLIICCDPILFRNESPKKIIRDFRYVIREQSYQVYSATRFIFSNKNDFAFAKIVTRDNPESVDPNRHRLTMT